MKIKLLLVIALAISMVSFNFNQHQDASLSISQLRCSGLENPVGTGMVPDFSWIFTDNKRRQIQIAYQIVVGSDSETVNNLTGTIWDSGKILYSDGPRKIIVSDETWKTSPSPITFTSIYGG
jgi:alpha-L-rhamnosidase